MSRFGDTSLPPWPQPWPPDAPRIGWAAAAQRFVTWGGQIVVGPAPAKPVEIARIECPSPRAVRVLIQARALDQDAGTVEVLMQSGLGRVVLPRVLKFSPDVTGDEWVSHEYEIPAQTVRIDVQRSEPASAAIEVVAVLAPVVPWLDCCR